MPKIGPKLSQSTYCNCTWDNWWALSESVEILPRNRGNFVKLGGASKTWNAKKVELSLSYCKNLQVLKSEDKSIDRRRGLPFTLFPAVGTALNTLQAELPLSIRTIWPIYYVPAQPWWFYSLNYISIAAYHVQLIVLSVAVLAVTNSQNCSLENS